MKKSVWFPSNLAYQPREGANEPQARIVCFHGAGSDPSMFVSQGSFKRPMANPLVKYCKDNNIHLLTVHLPGRTTRLREKMIESVEKIVEAVLQELCLLKNLECIPLVIAGHSMGAVCAFELARAMRSKISKDPSHLIMSCMVPADTPKEQRPWRPQRTLNTQELQDECRAWGINEEVFLPDMWKMYEPILRSDFQAMDAYNYETFNRISSTDETKVHFPVGLPTTIFFAEKDYRIQEKNWSDGWRSLFTDANCKQPDSKNFRVLKIPGGHNFFYEQENRVLWMEKTIEILEQVLLDFDYGTT